MTIFFKVGLRAIFYLVIAFLLFLYFINLIKFPEKEIKHNEGQPITTEEIIKKSKVELKNINKVQKEYDNFIICQYRKNKPCSIPTKENVKKHSINYFNVFIKNFIFFDYIKIKNDSLVIPTIYNIIFFTFLLQIFLLALSNNYQELLAITSKEKLDRIFLFTSEWTINSPPVLGVVGTIFSFGVLVSSLSETSSLTMLFKINFADAALTTIIGGSVYVLNLLINIFTTKNLATRKKTYNWLDMSKL